LNPSHTYSDKSLTVEQFDPPEELRLVFKGRSNERDPSKFLTPLFNTSLLQVGGPRALVLDFRNIEFMNSSTFTPLVRLLEEVRKGTTSVRLVYAAQVKWQTLSFSALKVFESGDGRVEIMGE